MRSFMYMLMAVMAVFGCQTVQPAPKSFTVDNNTIQIIGFMDSELMAQPLSELMAVPEGGTAYLYIFSLGGDPRVAGRFIDAMQGRTTVCMASAAGNGAFTVFQACTYRLLGDKAFLGNSRFGLRGSTGDPETDKKLQEQAEALTEKFIEIETEALDIDRDDYERMLDLGFDWSSPNVIMKNKGADAQVDFGCTKESHTDFLTRTVEPSPGEVVKVVVTQCPVTRKLAEPEDVPGPEAGEILGFPINGNVSEGA